MVNKKVQVDLNNLRSGTQLESDVVFGKKIFGGYHEDEVKKYINDLNAQLKNAENIFHNRLEEYSGISAMLTQERDKLLKELNEVQVSNCELNQKIDELKANNEALNSKLNELSDQVLNQDEIKIFEQTIIQNEEMKNKIIELNQVSEENIELKNDFAGFQLTIQDLSEKVKEFEKDESIKDEYEIIISENELLKLKYDETLSEKSLLLAEKNILIEQNKKVSDNLIQSSTKIKELSDINTKLKLKTRAMIAGFEAKIYESSQNHRQNIDQINQNIKNVMQLLSYENMDITKLLKGTYEEIQVDYKEELNDEPI